MPKVTVVTLPTKMLKHTVVKKKTPQRRYAVQAILHNGYALLVSLVYAKTTLLGVIAFLLGRVCMMGEFAPAGLALFTAVAQVEKKRALGVGVWSIAGVLSSGYYYEAGVYAFVIFSYVLWAERFISRYNYIVARMSFVFIAIICGNIIVSLFKELTLYTIVVALFEGGTCIVLAYIFMYGIPILMQSKATLYRKHITNERVSCIVVLLAIAVAGLGNVMVLEYSVRNIIGSLLIMSVALAAGAGPSTAMGVIMGLIVGLSDGNSTLIISLYAVAGILAGIFRGLGKLAIVTGFILGSGIIILYFGQDRSLVPILSECVIAGGLFCLVPRQQLAMWQRVSHQLAEGIQRGLQWNEGVMKINKIADMFSDMAGIFSNINVNTTEKNHDGELARVVAVIGERVCAMCLQRNTCWEIDLYRTYHGVLELLGEVDIQALAIENLPNVFQENCTQRKELLAAIKGIAACNQMSTLCQKKIIDQRHMMMEQMNAISTIIKSLATEINKEEYADEQLAVQLQEKSEMLGCSLSRTRVIGTAGIRGIETYKDPCNGNHECMHTILPLTASLIKEKITLRTECGKEGKGRKCRLLMEVARRFDIETGMVGIAKDGQKISGDTSAIITLPKGRIALVLSDGMGSGSYAQTQSMMAIAMVRRLLETGFDTAVAVEIVNSLLLLCSAEESFVTIDIAIVDTYSGNVEFLKIGSAASFIKRVREVTVIQSSALPIGILQQIEIQSVQSAVVVGDFIVMVSDGIMDVPQSKSAKGNWLANFLRQTVYSDAKMLAGQILSQARKMSDDRISDDMTVLVAKIIAGPIV